MNVQNTTPVSKSNIAAAGRRKSNLRMAAFRPQRTGNRSDARRRLTGLSDKYGDVFTAPDGWSRKTKGPALAPALF
jgi:hypothetical protein